MLFLGSWTLNYAESFPLEFSYILYSQTTKFFQLKTPILWRIAFLFIKSKWQANNRVPLGARGVIDQQDCRDQGIVLYTDDDLGLRSFEEEARIVTSDSLGKSPGRTRDQEITCRTFSCSWNLLPPPSLFT